MQAVLWVFLGSSFSFLDTSELGLGAQNNEASSFLHFSFSPYTFA